MIEISIRLFCVILLVLLTPLMVIQLIWYGLKYILTGNSEVGDPIPFIIVDYIIDKTKKYMRN